MFFPILILKYFLKFDYRASNVLNPYNKQRSTRVGNATVTLLVRHRPGKASITPDRPIASEGNGVTLTCSANPPGWPAPQYRWWRDLEGIFFSCLLFTRMCTYL